MVDLSSNQYSMYVGKRHMEFDVVVITGASRSGKTLLGRLLGSMHSVEHVDEPWLPMMMPVIQGKGLIDPDVATMVLQAFVEELFNDIVLLRTANFRPSDLSSIWEVKGAQEIFSRLVNLHSRDDVRRYVLEKRPVLLCNLAEVMPFLSFLIKTFPNCKIIHVVRNGLDVAMAVSAKQWFSDEQLRNPLNNQVFRAYEHLEQSCKYYLPWWLPEEKANLFIGMGDFARGLCYWCSLLEQSLHHIRELRISASQQYREVKYEALVRNPDGVLDDLTTFLGVEPSEQTAALLAGLEDRSSQASSMYPLGQVSKGEMECVTRMLSIFNYPSPEQL